MFIIEYYNMNIKKIMYGTKISIKKSYIYGKM